VTVLEPFEEAIKAVTGSNYPTINMISPLLYQICEIARKINENDNLNLKISKKPCWGTLKER